MGQVQQIDNARLKAFLQKPEPPLVLDVRTPGEYKQLGHIPGAWLIPTYELTERLTDLNPKQALVVVCEHGVRSADASYYLLQNGFETVYNLESGMACWDGERHFGQDFPAG